MIDRLRRRRAATLSRGAADYLEALALGLPMKTRTRTRRTISIALAGTAIAVAGTATWALIPNTTHLPGGVANESPPPQIVGHSPCHVSGQNLTISVPCDQLNRWLEGEGS